MYELNIPIQEGASEKARMEKQYLLHIELFEKIVDPFDRTAKILDEINRGVLPGISISSQDVTIIQERLLHLRQEAIQVYSIAAEGARHDFSGENNVQS
jgi:hypothetical protein